MTTALFLLRCTQIGVGMSDLDLLTVGMVNDMYTEHANDSCDYPTVADQHDFDNF